jgi:hypothetical protein
MPAVPGGRPARPAGWHPGRLPLPPATARARTGSPPGTAPRPSLPAFPSGRDGRVVHRSAAQLADGTFPVPHADWPGSRLDAGPAGAGLDAAGGAERPSSRTHGRAAPGNVNRSRSAPRHPGRRPRNPR